MCVLWKLVCPELGPAGEEEADIVRKMVVPFPAEDAVVAVAAVMLTQAVSATIHLPQTAAMKSAGDGEYRDIARLEMTGTPSALLSKAITIVTVRTG